MAAPAPAPAPGSLLLPLPLVPQHPSTRVRFLGCIKSYDPATSQLTLTHPPSPTQVRADVSLAAGALPPGALRDGQWVNVLGHTADAAEPAGVVVVRALLVWGAGGALRLGEYERVAAAGLRGGEEGGGRWL